MDFKDHVKQLAERVMRVKESVSTEEAAKNAMIMPFLQVLGYDVFNPLEIVPEYVTDVGTKKGEKIDYAVFKDGVPAILVECKHHGQNLDLHDGQLLRYFHVSPAKFGILTNGIQYRFYSDLVDMNRMDEKPFLEFYINSITDAKIEELKKFHKSYFDVDAVTESANELMYLNELRSVVQREIADPSDEFTRYFARLVYEGNVSAKVLEQFKGYVRRTFGQYINDVLNERLQLAIKQQDSVATETVTDGQESPAIAQGAIEEKPRTETTQEELEGYLIVKSILHGHIDPKRVAYRDAQTYFTVLLDDNNRKIICRLWFNGKKKFIGTFDEAKNEIKHELATNDDIFAHAQALIETAKRLATS